MLKQIPGGSMESSSSDDGGDLKIRSLQRQLDELRGKSLRVLRLARMQPCEDNLGLLDSGATRPLRPRRPQEDVRSYKKVRISLAGGRMVEMAMSPGGAIIGNDDAERTAYWSTRLYPSMDGGPLGDQPPTERTDRNEDQGRMPPSVEVCCTSAHRRVGRRIHGG